MLKRLLIATDGSENAKNAVIYAAGLVSGNGDSQCILIHVQPTISHYIIDEAQSNARVREVLQHVMDENTAQSRSILEQGRKLLLDRGVHPAAIETVSHHKVAGLAKDLIDLGRRYEVDAIVAGSRGVVADNRLSMGSTSTKLIEHAGEVPVWIVDGPVRPERFLVAVDVNSDSERMVAYLARVFGGNPQAHFTYYHVLQDFKLAEIAPRISGAAEIDEIVAQREKQIIETFWSQTFDRLTAQGLSAAQLEMRTPCREHSIGRMIINEAEENHYGTIILSRQGADRAYYFGHVARYISERLDERALWIVG